MKIMDGLLHRNLALYGIQLFMHHVKHTLLKMGSYSSTTMCQYWDNHLINITEQYTDYFTNTSQ